MPTLNIKVTRVAYPAPTVEGDWYILITNRGVCKGKMPWRPKTGEALALSGEWATYRGEREFKFSAASLDIPVNPRDQLHYVCERTVGMGPTLEAQIWETRGADWQDVDPSQVKRLTAKVYEEFRLQIRSLESDQEHVKTVAWLMGKGATMNMANAAWEKWEAEAIGVVSSDCYRLAGIAGYGFQDVDKAIRVNFGVDDDDERRVSACVLYSLRRLTDDGSTVVTWESLLKQACGTLGGFSGLVVACTRKLFEDEALKGFKESQSISLAGDYFAEMMILKYVDDEQSAEAGRSEG